MGPDNHHLRVSTRKTPDRPHDPGCRSEKGNWAKQSRGQANEKGAQMEGTEEDGGKQ